MKKSTKVKKTLCNCGICDPTVEAEPCSAGHTTCAGTCWHGGCIPMSEYLEILATQENRQKSEK